uniref:Uncharacterized protein n=1 Tax=Triticum urartu TaxID=4572 RepID=A0A8R7UBE4_TRIUA
ALSISWLHADAVTKVQEFFTVADCGDVRQSGQLGRRRSHSSTHRRWNACRHPGSRRSSSPSAYSARHTAHVVSSCARSLPSVEGAASGWTSSTRLGEEYTDVGYAASSASSIPAVAHRQPSSMSSPGCDDDEEEPCPWRRRLEQRKVRTESRTSAATEAQISTVSLDMAI